MSESARKAEVKSCAAKLFRKKGFAATSMRDIADAMGIKAASLYNHIKSKQEILQELLLSIATRYTDGIDRIAAASGNSIQKLELMVLDHIRITIDHTDSVSLVPTEWVHLEEPAFQQFLSLRDHYEKQFRTAFQQCIQDGYLEDVNVDVAIFSILSSLRLLYSWYSKNKQIDSQELERQLLKTLISGVRKES